VKLRVIDELDYRQGAAQTLTRAVTEL
jgi:hypothetical protein